MSNKKEIKREDKNKDKINFKDYNLIERIRGEKNLIFSIKEIILIVIFIIVTFIFVKVNFYKLFPQKTIVSSIHNESKLNSFKDNTLIKLSQDFSVINDESELDITDSTTDINLSSKKYVNDEFMEEANYISLSMNDYNFDWMRFNRHDLIIAKSPFEPQYIYFEDAPSYGYSYNRRSNVINNALLEHVRGIKRSNFVKVYREPVNIKDNNGLISGFLKFYLGNSNRYKSVYHIKGEEQEANRLLESILMELSKDNNYKSFKNEEKDIQKALGLKEDRVDELEKAISTTISKYKANNYDLQIIVNSKGVIENINLNLTLNPDKNKDDLPLILSLIVNKDKINEDFNVEDERFSLNIINFDDLKPRPEKRKYVEDVNTQEIEENTGTFDDLEELEENITLDHLNIDEESIQEDDEGIIIPDEIKDEIKKEP